MADITVDGLKGRLQSAIDSINTSIRSNKFGTNTIDELNKQKQILSAHIDDISAKDSVNEDDEKNTTRLIAIASNKQLSAEPKSSSNNALLISVVIVFGIAAFMYYKKNN